MKRTIANWETFSAGVSNILDDPYRITFGLESGEKVELHFSKRDFRNLAYHIIWAFVARKKFEITRRIVH